MQRSNNFVSIIMLQLCNFHMYAQGSGQSDGKYVTLGWREQDDLAIAIEHLRGLGTVSTIGLWGRSMGAVTALLYSQKDPSIAGVVRVSCGYSSIIRQYLRDFLWYNLAVRPSFIFCVIRYQKSACPCGGTALDC